MKKQLWVSIWQTKFCIFSVSEWICKKLITFVRHAQLTLSFGVIVSQDMAMQMHFPSPTPPPRPQNNNNNNNILWLEMLKEKDYLIWCPKELERDKQEKIYNSTELSSGGKILWIRQIFNSSATASEWLPCICRAWDKQNSHNTSTDQQLKASV